MVYQALARCLNRTELSLTSETLSVRHAPLPWRGDGTYSRAGLRGVERGVKITYSKQDHRVRSYHVSVRLQNQDLVRLMSNMTEKEARFVEGTLADALAPPHPSSASD